MRIKIACILIIAFLLPLLTFSQQRWYSNFGRPGERENSVCVKESYDKGYIISGGYYNEVGLIAKVNSDGDYLWDKVLVSGNLFVKLYAHDEISSGRKVLAGHAGPNPLIVSLNACGEMEWCYTFSNIEHFEGGLFLDVILYDDGHSLAMAHMGTVEQENQAYLFFFDPIGELVWMKGYAKAETDPDLGFLLPFTMDTIGGDYFITGYCYYRRNDNPDVFTLRPMFVKIDENYNEEWLLPYGHNVGLVGTGKGVIKESDSTYRGFGRYNSGSGYNGVMMNFTDKGIETDYTGIPNHLLNDNISDNYMIDIVRMNDSLFMASAIYAFNHGSLIEMGEYIVSSKGNVYESQFHANTVPAYYAMLKTGDSKFVFAGVIQQDSEWDMLLYKLNADLSSTDPVEDTITYDYLCDNLPIVSDTIDLSTCGIVTGTADIPSPEEYYSNLSIIPINVMPNPASNRVTVQFENTDGYSNLQLKCYNTSGSLMLEESLTRGTDELNLNISNWKTGLYFLVINSDNGKKGSAKFVVK